jgi:hypothetical protein
LLDALGALQAAIDAVRVGGPQPAAVKPPGTEHK